MKTLVALLRAAVAAGILVSGAAQASLIDKGGGVVFDSVSLLEWEQSPNPAQLAYGDAKNYVSGLGLAGGGWRLPTIANLRGLYDDIAAATGCTDCTGDQGPFHAIALGYWTTSTYFGGQPGAYYVGFWRPNYVAGLYETTGAWVWAVRDGTPLPEPGTAGLALMGALAWAAALRRPRRTEESAGSA